MLAIRPSCEHCGKALPNESAEAMICTFECTFCSSCVAGVLHNVCPNCGGGFERRPTRPRAQLDKYPVSKSNIVEPVVKNNYLTKYKTIDPRER